MRTLRISVRRLVEFLLRAGDIDSSNDWRAGIEAMQPGSNIHRMLQASADEAYRAEVPLAGTVFFPNNIFDPYAARLEIREETIGDQAGFFLRIEGRADGIIDATAPFGNTTSSNIGVEGSNHMAQGNNNGAAHNSSSAGTVSNGIGPDGALGDFDIANGDSVGPNNLGRPGVKSNGTGSNFEPSAIHPLVIDEIKGVTRDVSAIEEPAVIHEAQALCYAYLYLRSSRGSSALATAFEQQVVVRLTYASITTGEVRQLERIHSVSDIESWFFSLLEKAQRWAAWRVRHDELRKRSLSSLTFPFEPRDGQQEIMNAVTTTIREGGRLYVQAPTGSGKTIATMYPALKSMGENKTSHIAYLTSKTMTRRAALECLELLRRQSHEQHQTGRQDLWQEERFKPERTQQPDRQALGQPQPTHQTFDANVLVVTARNKICPLRSKAHNTDLRARPLASLCNPIECPLARKHYDFVNDALFEAITTYDVLDARHIEEVAARHHVCPYELQRDAAPWCDVIVCDYHYAFAPSAGLIGLSDEPSASTVFLVDEAHNLPERMRSMYSAELAVGDLKLLERILRARRTSNELLKTVQSAISAFPAWNKSLQDATPPNAGRANRPTYQATRLSDAFADSLSAIVEGIDATLEDFFATADRAPNMGPVTAGEKRHHNRTTPAAGRRATVSDVVYRAESIGVAGRRTADGAAHHTEETPKAGRNIGTTGEAAEAFLTLRDVSFKIRAFLGAWQRSEAGYVTFLGRAENGSRKIKVYCVDPHHDLAERLKQAKAAIFFSGTLLPMDYHRKLLAAQDDDTTLYAQSSFDYRRQQVLIASDISARYSKRGPKLYIHIAKYLMALMRAHPGNYLAFLPSYAMMEEVTKALSSLVDNSVEVIHQHPSMRESDREHFVARFREPHARSTSLLGLCVLGGIFGESIDLPGEALVGVVVVGTGMPSAYAEREVIRDYFDAKKDKGFAYAYTYPGIIKVLQAAGRLMRTETDHGVVLLLDNRFLEDELQQAFPKEWQNVRTCTLETLQNMM